MGSGAMPPENFRKIYVQIAHFPLILPARYHTPVAQQSYVCNSGAKFFSIHDGGHSPMSPIWLRPGMEQLTTEYVENSSMIKIVQKFFKSVKTLH